MNLINTRKKYDLTQSEAAHLLNVPLRTYVRYEQDDDYGDVFKRNMMIKTLNDICEITEDKGILTLSNIKNIVVPILKDSGVNFCYLFGSYAKGSPNEKSDVDLLVDTDLTGFDFYGLVEQLRVTLHKKVDLLRLKDLQKDNPIILEILKEGVRIL